ncbi:3'-5' exonuclease [Faecalibaculum rodentium]|uniref:3'-5' exonuclease n=1 Tax=Faecalibaculum rodentium TaxID=1702221 RepID=UPI0027306B32|nr:3'-5' exonuclease [Faecalibaculum rodentium]
MKKFKPGFLFWFLLFMTLGCLSQGNFIGVIIFAVLAIWRYIFIKNRFDQTPPPVPPEKADPVSYSSAITPPDTTAKQPAPTTTVSAKEYTSLVDIPNHDIVLSKEKRKRQNSFPGDFKNSFITKRGEYHDFTVLDTETTGLSPYKDRIVQVAAIRFRDGEPAEKFTTFINPKRSIPSDASEINGITDEMVEDYPTFSEIVQDLDDFIGSDNIVGHNVIFDVKFLYYSGSKILDKKRKYLDTYKISKRAVKAQSRYNPDSDYDYDVENHKLPTLLDYYGIPTEESHRADSDALATGYLFNELVEQLQFDREYV